MALIHCSVKFQAFPRRPCQQVWKPVTFYHFQEENQNPYIPLKQEQLTHINRKQLYDETSNDLFLLSALNFVKFLLTNFFIAVGGSEEDMMMSLIKSLCTFMQTLKMTQDAVRAFDSDTKDQVCENLGKIVIFNFLENLAFF